MTLQEEIDRALRYFTNEEHDESFIQLEGGGGVLFSAPHAVLQTRNGRLKCAERFTGMLCMLLNSRCGRPAIYKARHLNDDANHDAVSDYRDALCDAVRSHGIRCVLDLHQLKPSRPMELCIGTGYGANLCGFSDAPAIVTGCFRNAGFTRLTIDDPFAASREHTVSATVAAQCGVPCMQLELNTGLLMRESDAYRFERVLEALEETAARLDAALGNEGSR